MLGEKGLFSPLQTFGNSHRPLAVERKRSIIKLNAPLCAKNTRNRRLDGLTLKWWRTEKESTKG